MILGISFERRSLFFSFSSVDNSAGCKLILLAWLFLCMLCCLLSIPLLGCILTVQSYAKNMGLYGERIGSLTVITSDPKTTKKVDSQLKAVSTPIHNPVICHSCTWLFSQCTDQGATLYFGLPLNPCCVLILIRRLV